MIYILIFFLSLIFLFFGESVKNGILKKILLIISFSLPCIVAGLRDYSIGGDVNLYIYPLYLNAKGSSFINFIFNNPYMKDYLYLIITYISSNVFNSMFSLLFIIDFLVIIPIYRALKVTYNKKSQIIIGMFILYSVLYNASFNMARQSIALSMSVLAIAFLEKNNRKLFLLISLLAIMFHWSSVFLIFIYLLYRIIKSDRLSAQKKIVFEMEILIGALGLIFIIPNLSNILYLIGMGDFKITKFLNEFKTDHFTSNSTADTLFFLGIIFVMLYYKHLFKKNDNCYNFNIFMMILGLIVMQFGSFIKFGFRLSFIFLYPPLFLSVPKIFHINRTKKIFIYDCLIFAMFAFYWFFWVIIANYHSTYPYVFFNN